mmetsp:Transcript_23602/g.56891  ORF Transcript_23602/g.56891 Transcript_23602/m.56891 type:complete len:385 (+) Transcript_23602:465-1619(+)
MQVHQHRRVIARNVERWQQVGARLLLRLVRERPPRMLTQADAGADENVVHSTIRVLADLLLLCRERAAHLVGCDGRRLLQRASLIVEEVVPSTARDAPQRLPHGPHALMIGCCVCIGAPYRRRAPLAPPEETRELLKPCRLVLDTTAQVCRDHRERKLVRFPTQRRTHCTLVALRVVKRQEVERQQIELVRTPEERDAIVVGVLTRPQPELAAVGARLGRQRDADIAQVLQVASGVASARVRPFVDGTVLLAVHRALVAQRAQLLLRVGHVIKLFKCNHVRLRRGDELEHPRPTARPVDDGGVVALCTLSCSLIADAVCRSVEHVAHEKAVVRQPIGEHVPLQDAEGSAFSCAHSWRTNGTQRFFGDAELPSACVVSFTVGRWL